MRLGYLRRDLSLLREHCIGDNHDVRVDIVAEPFERVAVVPGTAMLGHLVGVEAGVVVVSQAMTAPLCPSATSVSTMGVLT